MSDDPHLKRVWDIVERLGVAMLTTNSGDGFRARPVELRPDRAVGLIWIVTNLHSAKQHEIEAEHDVGLVCVDASDNVYLSITARADVLADHAKTAEVWRFTDRMWWKGPNDPQVSLLRVTPKTAELWDGPASGAVAAFEFIKSQLTGAEPNLGENRKVSVDLRDTSTDNDG
jgi:general stress protein 26